MKKKHDSFVEDLRRSKKTILLIAVVIVITLIISSLVSMWLGQVTDFTFPTIGTITWRGVEGYWDSNLTNKTKECNWGTIWPGASKNVTLYLRSTSNVETTLNLATGNWTFWDSNNRIVEGANNSLDYLSLEWDYNGSGISPDEIVKVALTLSASRSPDFISFLITNDVARFDFDIVISTESS